jgi:hypothetical protein
MEWIGAKLGAGRREHIPAAEEQAPAPAPAQAAE